MGLWLCDRHVGEKLGVRKMEETKGIFRHSIFLSWVIKNVRVQEKI